MLAIEGLIPAGLADYGTLGCHTSNGTDLIVICTAINDIDLLAVVGRHWRCQGPGTLASSVR